MARPGGGAAQEAAPEDTATREAGPAEAEPAGPVEAEAEPAGPEPADRGRSRRRGSGWLIFTTVAVLAVLLGLVVWLALGRDPGTADAGEVASPTTSTAEVVRRDLVETESFDGTLGFDERSEVVAASAGTMTSIVDEGTIVRRGEELYRIDDRPVLLLYGTVPAYRVLAEGVSDGPDVRALERNLVALGHRDADLTVDEEFTAATTAAVERWQEDVGVEQTGIVAPGSVVFLDGAVRVGQHLSRSGSRIAPGASVMEVSSNAPVVDVDLPADRQTLVAVGDTVDVELPGGERVPGSIREVGAVAESHTLPDGSQSQPTIPLVIELEGTDKPRFDQAPVTVFIRKSESQDVLAVPVTALIAVSGGGYAVEVVDGATTRLVGVEPGAFADGFVEITGDVDEGTTVVVPA